jgi:hypothetical protein
MRTNINLDDQLVEEAFKLSRAKTKKELIHKALEEFVQSRLRLSLLDLEGRINPRNLRTLSIHRLHRFPGFFSSFFDLRCPHAQLNDLSK